MKKLLLAVLLMGVGLFVGCGGSSSSSGGGGNTVTLVAIQVTPATPSIAAGANQQFKATGTYSDGSTKDLTATATWVSSNPAAATVTSAGLATGVMAGSATISATVGSVSNSTVLTVMQAALVSIAVTPATMSIAPGTTQLYTATGTYADHSTQNITSSVTWRASIGATITAGGLATGVTPNTTATIMAAQGSIAGTATLTITNPLVSIAVTPTAQTIHLSTTQPFVATGTYADNSTQVITTGVTWASSNTAVATISNSAGTQGQASAVAAGTTMITAMLGSITSPPATLTVSSATLQSIAVTPATITISLGNQQQYAATGTFSDGTTQDVTNIVTWASSSTSKVSMTVSGLATGVAVTSSPVTITASKGSVTSPAAMISVIPPTLSSITITPSSTTSDTTLAQGTSRQYTAIGTQSNGSTLPITGLATWTSSNPPIATVGLHSGLVKAQPVTNSHNPVTIMVSYSGVSQTLTLDVTNATVVSITVTPITANVPVGLSHRFTAWATFSDSSTQDISLNASWTSSNTAVATVSVTGSATGVSPGVSSISAKFGGVLSGPAQFTVSSATVASIAVSPTGATLAPGSTLNYQAVATYSDGTAFSLGGLATWASSNNSIASVSGLGAVTGQSAGTANITATYNSVTSNLASVLVTSSPLASITITPPSPSVPEAVELQLTATGTFADPTTPPQDLTTNVTWASSQMNIASVNAQGLATGVSPGSATITAVFAGIVNAPPTVLTVSNATIMSIAVTTTTPTVTAGTPVQFTAIGTFSDGSTINLGSQVTWTSSDVTVATINNVGSVNTAKAGTVTITATLTQNSVTVSGTANLTVQ